MMLWVAPLSSISSIERRSCSETDETERTWPVPPHCGHLSVELSSTLERMRWRDISSRPKCEMWPTWMRARSLLERLLQAALDRAVVALLVHVDEVDDDETREVAQPQLPRDLVGGFEIGLERGVLDVVLARGAAGIDVDRHQRFGLVDDDVAAGAQLHHRLEHGVELVLDRRSG